MFLNYLYKCEFICVNMCLFVCLSVIHKSSDDLDIT